MRGLHKAGDTVLLEAKVTGVDEGNLKDVYAKNEDGTPNKEQVIGCEGDTFVHLSVLGHDFSVRGTQIGEPIKPITASELEVGESSEGSTESESKSSEASASTGVAASASEAGESAPVATASEPTASATDTTSASTAAAAPVAATATEASHAG